MKQKFIVTVDVPEDSNCDDVANDIKLAIMQTDGEQHLEHMNWEPIKMSDPKVVPEAGIGPDPKMKDINENNCVRVNVCEHRCKVFCFNIPEGKDVDSYFWECVDKIKDAYDKDHDVLADAESAGFEYNDYDNEFDWKDYSPNMPGFDMPMENGDWMFKEEEQH